MQKGQEFLKRQNLDESDSKIILDKCAKIFKIEKFQNLFAPHSMSEVPIFTKNNLAEVQMRRIDRLVIDDNEITILDYKTNRVSPKTLTQVPQSYVKQLKEYREILSNIYPQKQINCILLFIESMDWFEI